MVLRHLRHYSNLHITEHLRGPTLKATARTPIISHNARSTFAYRAAFLCPGVTNPARGLVPGITAVFQKHRKMCQRLKV